MNVDETGGHMVFLKVIMLPIVLINPVSENEEKGWYFFDMIFDSSPAGALADTGVAVYGLLKVAKSIYESVSSAGKKESATMRESVPYEYVVQKQWDFDELCRRYQDIRYKMIFLPLKRGIDLKKFVEDFKEDVHYCSGDSLDFYYNAEDLKRNAHQTLIPALGMKSAVELPALALWEWNPKEAVSLPLSGLSEDEIYQVIEHLCNRIKEKPDISLAGLVNDAGLFREKLEEKKRPTLILQKVIENDVRIASNCGFVNVVTGDSNHIEQSSSALGGAPQQWQQFIDVLRANGVEQREQGGRMMELLEQIKLAVQSNDEVAVQEKVEQVRELLKGTGSDMILQGLNLAGSLASIVSVLGL